MPRQAEILTILALGVRVLTKTFSVDGGNFPRVCLRRKRNLESASTIEHKQLWLVQTAKLKSPQYTCRNIAQSTIFVKWNAWIFQCCNLTQYHNHSLGNSISGRTKSGKERKALRD